METTFVGIEQKGFWMRDAVLEAWLRLLALHVETTPDEAHPGRAMQKQWLLASTGVFGGFVPHELEIFANDEDSRVVLKAAISSLLDALRGGPSILDRETLLLLGLHWEWADGLDTSRLIDVGEAFIDLSQGRIDSDASSTDFMPGSHDKR